MLKLIAMVISRAEINSITISYKLNTFLKSTNVNTNKIEKNYCSLMLKSKNKTEFLIPNSEYLNLITMKLAASYWVKELNFAPKQHIVHHRSENTAHKP